MERDKEIASHASEILGEDITAEDIKDHSSEILGEDITAEDIKDHWINVEVALQNVEYRLDMIEEVLGIDEGYTLPMKEAKALIANKRRQFNES